MNVIFQKKQMQSILESIASEQELKLEAYDMQLHIMFKDKRTLNMYVTIQDPGLVIVNSRILLTQVAACEGSLGLICLESYNDRDYQVTSL